MIVLLLLITMTSTTRHHHSTTVHQHPPCQQRCYKRYYNVLLLLRVLRVYHYVSHDRHTTTTCCAGLTAAPTPLYRPASYLPPATTLTNILPLKYPYTLQGLISDVYAGYRGSVAFQLPLHLACREVPTVKSRSNTDGKVCGCG